MQAEDLHRDDPVTADEAEDPALTAALEEYLSAREAGQRPNRQEFLGRHPEMAEALGRCLDSLELLCTAAPQLAKRPAAEPPLVVGANPEALGDFRILREVGRGGMGVVYEAVQLSLGRRVALKVLPFAAALDPRQLQRFKNEAQAAANLHHSHIVPVHAVGCERGVHYYAMQFIDGKTVAVLVRELRQEAGRAPEEETVTPAPSPENGPVKLTEDQPTTYFQLPDPPEKTTAITTLKPSALATERSAGPGFFRTVASLTVQAAEALDYAHQIGIVHRDIKPANLLVDDRGHLWITDFGLARGRNDANLTLTGDLIGTLRYMSPEQAMAKRGLVDHRTDIYSLGATLYELVTLEPVFPGNDRRELLQQIAFEEPASPRSIDRTIPRELETIVLKALAKNPEERYATAQELADDLRRFLEDKPIRARRPTFLEKSVKWLKRHRSVAAAAVVGLMLAVVGLACSTVLIAGEQARTNTALKAAEDQRRFADGARTAEAEQRLRAEEGFRQAQQALDLFVQFSEAELDRPEMQEVRRKLLRAALDYYDGFIQRHGDDPTLLKELRESHARVALILDEMGDPAAGMAHAQQAHRITQANPHLQKDLTSIYNNLGGFFGDGRLKLLGNKSVREELKLSEEQAQTVTEMSEQRRELMMNGWRNLGWEPWQEKMKAMTTEEGLRVTAALKPEQRRRLEQIALQQRGPQALSDPEVADRLRLEEEQRLKVGGLVDKMRVRSFGGSHHGGHHHYWPPRPPRSDDTAKMKQQLVEVLTAEQKTKWQEMLGEPFKGEIRHGPPPGWPWKGGR